MSSTFDNYVVKSILANNQYGITEVNELANLASGYFVFEEYDRFKNLIQEGDLAAIKFIFKNQTESGEFLEVMQFKDQTGNVYIAIVYDGTELLQDPEVMDVFSVAASKRNELWINQIRVTVLISLYASWNIFNY